MHTAHMLTVSPSMLCAGGVGVSALGGCLLLGVVIQGVSAMGAVCSRGGGGVSAPRGVCSWGVYLVLGGVPGQVLPPVDRHTLVNTLPVGVSRGYTDHHQGRGQQ